MIPFFEWFERSGFRPQDPWLVFGKGPSFANRGAYELRPFHTLSLNHAVREQRVTVAHMIDLDVVDSCGPMLWTNAEAVVLPWVPHVGNAPGQQTLEELVATHSVLRDLDRDQRLLWYNLGTAPPRPGSPTVEVKYFSAVAAIRLLAMAGVRQVRSLGIDGGKSYSAEFADLSEKTLLANRWSSFDRQFKEIARIIVTMGVDYAPLDVESPVRVYVGTTEAQMLAVKVLEFSIRKHASMSVQVFPLHRSGVEIPKPQAERNQPRTPFSFQRFLIPQLAGYQGRAIYLDSDMQVFRDIKQLWTIPFDGADLLAAREPKESGRKPQFSVMLLNCDRLRWDAREIVNGLDKGEFTYERLMQDMCVASQVRDDIPPVWNSLERYEEGKTALLHYTDMPTQPWVSQVHRFGYLWVRDLLEAIGNGSVSRELVAEHVTKGWVRPSLLYQIDHGIEDGLLLPKEARELDRGFTPPFHELPSGASPWRAPALRLLALVRDAYRKSPVHRFERRVRARLTR